MAITVSVKELNTVTNKIAMYVGERVAEQLSTINGLHICAGIKGNPVLQKRARINHYGGEGVRTTTVKRWETSFTATGQKRLRYRKVKMMLPYRIPERHFIDSAVSNGMLGSANRNIVEYVEQALKGHARISTYNGSVQTTTQRESAFSKGIGPQRFVDTLGAKMVANQRQAIMNATPPNMPSTVKRKGKNTPLRDSLGLYEGLEHWAER